jgi:hypothetical protein
MTTALVLAAGALVTACALFWMGTSSTMDKDAKPWFHFVGAICLTFMLFEIHKAFSLSFHSTYMIIPWAAALAILLLSLAGIVLGISSAEDVEGVPLNQP